MYYFCSKESLHFYNRSQDIPTDKTNDLSRADLFLKQIVCSHGFCQLPQGVSNWVSLPAIPNTSATHISVSLTPIISLF